MSPAQYTELIDFLGKKFAAMDRRFDALEAQMDRMAGPRERPAEPMARFQEAMTGFQEAMNQRFQETDRKLDDLRDLIVTGHRDLGERVSRLEAKVGLA